MVTERVPTTGGATVDEFNPEHHVYEPHRVGLPKLGPYFRELWARRQFALELAHTTMRSQHTQTFFGQAWLIINPLLLASVYYLLVDIIGRHKQGPEYFAHLLAGLFAFYFVANSMSSGASSVVSGGRLILNTAFPRLLLPLSSVYIAFRRFLPTMAIFLVVQLVAVRHLSATMLIGIPILVELILFASGLAMFFATLQVYFRDASSFLPYVTRIWLYLSPVLYYVADISPTLRHVMVVNPLYPILGAWSEAMVQNEVPSMKFLIAGLLWGVASATIGALVFMSREREFAVRI